MENDTKTPIPSCENSKPLENEDLTSTLVSDAENDKLLLTMNCLQKFKDIAATRSSHKNLLQDGVSLGLVILSLGSESQDAVNLSLDILQLFAQYPENREQLSKLPCIFDALNDAMKRPNQHKEVKNRARWISSTLTQKGLEIKNKDKKSHRKPLGQKSQNLPKKAERARKNSKSVYLRIAGVCLERTRNELTEMLRKIEGIISITYVVPKSVCLILSHIRVPSEVYGKAVANMGFECDLVAWNGDNEEVWIKQYPDDWEGSQNLTGKENEPEYLPDSEDEKDKSVIGDQAMVRHGEIMPEKQGGWLKSAASFLQNSFYW